MGVPGHALSRWRAGLRFEECELTKGPQRMTPLRAKDEFQDVGTIRLQLRSGPRRTVACQKATASKAVLTNKIKIKLRGPINRHCRKASVLHFRCAAISANFMSPAPVSTLILSSWVYAFSGCPHGGRPFSRTAALEEPQTDPANLLRLFSC